jgi:predicted  nucleic acid-binding Zn-ribbon protein
MTFESNKFDMGAVMNKLRSIAENGTERLDELDPGMEQGGKEIDTSSFTRTMNRLQSIKDAVSEDHYNALRSGVRALYMNRRPNLQQMTALMDLLETVLAYVAEDNSLFQRLKTDLSKDSEAASAEPEQEVGAPTTASPPPQAQQEPEMRGLKT